MTRPSVSTPQATSKPWLPSLVERVRVAARARDREDHWHLLTLTPGYLPAEHADYVAALESALRTSEVRNIALSGSYGVGKSSILRELARNNRRSVVEISLSTLAPVADSELDESIPRQATTPTNRIQQEIVKQLLYRERPGRIRGSRFRRIERFNWWREAGIAVLLGLGAATVFLLADWTADLQAEITKAFDPGLWIHAIIAAGAALTVLVARRLTHGRLHIKQFSAGSATVTLDDRSVSFFDQYLDEIVYFFQVTRKTVVIFEDLDRFNDSHIFETLRALNTLLNSAPRIKKPIRFIYAIRDSIFDRIGLELEGRPLDPALHGLSDPAQVEAGRANRTKFFDLVIPVVPFITHRTARSVASRLMSEIDHKIDPNLIDLATRYLPDMRLLKNIRNEFVVFRARIFAGEGQRLELSETGLFAMMLYKNTHLIDFENIRFGRSALDQLYAASRTLVRQNVERIEGELQASRRRLLLLETAAARAKRLGARLEAHVARTARAAGLSASTARYTLGNSIWAPADLQKPEAWTQLAEAPADTALNWRNDRNQGLSFGRADLAAALGDKLDANEWRSADGELLAKEVSTHQADLRFLRTADMGALMALPRFAASRDGEDETLDAAAKRLLTDGLAYRLVRDGYVDRNFTLYTSTFHGERVTAAATNFIIHHVERGVMDEHFQLSGADVEAVVRESGEKALGDAPLYNIAIMDHLLRTNLKQANVMIASLTSFGPEQERFLGAYLSNGAETDRFVGRLAALSADALKHLIDSSALDDESKARLVGEALAHLEGEVAHDVDEATARYLTDHADELPTLRDAPLEHARAERIAKLFARAGVVLATLEPFSSVVRKAFVEHGLYVVTVDNLRLAVPHSQSLSLDSIMRADENVFVHILANLDIYLDLEGVGHTVEDAAAFVEVIDAVLSRAPARLDDIVARASASCVVADLGDVPEDAWQALAATRRFPATYANLASYVERFGLVDEHLAAVLLAHGAISEHEPAAEEDKEALALAIVAARDFLPPEVRAELAASLSLARYLDVAQIKPESGDLFPKLVSLDVVAGDEVTFAHLAGTDWKTREAVIHVSPDFLDLMTPDLVSQDLANVLASARIDDAIKAKLVSESDEYFVSADRRDLSELARHAADSGALLSLSMIERAAMGQAAARHIVRLLGPHLDSVPNEKLFGVLDALGWPYDALTRHGWDSPEVPNTPADVALLEALRLRGIVSSFKRGTNMIKVNKRRKLR